MIHTTRPVLAALIDSRRAWVSPEEIQASTGLDQDAVDVAIEELIASGYFDRWVRKPGSVVTLTTWGAWKLGYRLTEDGAENVFRWVKGKDDAPEPRRRRPRGSEPPSIDETPSSAPGPVELAELAEEQAQEELERIEFRARKGMPLRPEDVAPPTVVLMGHSGFVWCEVDAGGKPSGYCPSCNKSEAANKKRRADCQHRRGYEAAISRGVCPACWNRPLKRSTACGRCHRWGWDSYFHLGEYARKETA